MVAPAAAWSSGARGIAFEADTAARLRQTANADATSIFIGLSFRVVMCRNAARLDIAPNMAPTKRVIRIRRGAAYQ
jgi:hypothetical protein